MNICPKCGNDIGPNDSCNLCGYRGRQQISFGVPLSLASWLLGVLGLILAIKIYLFVLVFLLGLGGFITGYLGKSNEQYKRQATSGMYLSIFTMLVAVVLLLVVIARLT